jgi:hypothetical protein
MPAFLISVLTMLLVLAGSCSSTPPATQKGEWSLELRTSGGFIGSGKGNISIDSERKCVYSETNRDQVKSSIIGTLYPRQFQPISEAVAQLDPKGWNKPGLNIAAPDAFGYKLEFRTGPDKKEITTVQWYDNTADQLPDDLKKLDAVLEQTMKARCSSQPETVR